jgi:hypothetical protein
MNATATAKITTPMMMPFDDWLMPEILQPEV